MYYCWTVYNHEGHETGDRASSAVSNLITPNK